MNEQLSALVDDELGPRQREEMVRTLGQDAELRRGWERAHLIGAVMREEFEALVEPGLADRIATRLGEAPTVLAPRLRARQLAHQVTRIAGSLAIAASVAAVAIFGLRLLPGGTLGQPVAVVSQDQGQGQPARAELTQWDQQPAAQRALNVYLVEHNAFTPDAGMNGMMSYVRVVGYNSGQ